MKLHDSVVTLKDVCDIFGRTLVIAGTRGVVTEVRADDDAVFIIEFAAVNRRVTFFEDEIGDLIEVSPP